MPSCCCNASSSATPASSVSSSSSSNSRAPSSALEQPQRLVARDLAHPRHAVLALAGAAAAPRAHERLLHDFVDVLGRAEVAPRLPDGDAPHQLPVPLAARQMRAVPLACNSHQRSIAEVA